MKYEPVIGLEVHLQPKTKSKMFCSCSAEYFSHEPNTHLCPVCLGLPGALPVPNRKAIEHCIELALALNCTINQESKFDRKNYFYPDLPKGYQISQYDQPIGEKGFVEVDLEGDARRFRITRVHLEEDTGKSIHQGEKTLLDFNKSGVPLIEIVTEPDFVNEKEIDVFAKRLRQIVRYCAISDADMEKGQMRFELNISLRKEGEKSLPDYKIEVKNIGSISLLQKVIAFEINRQTELLEDEKKISQETRGVVDSSGKTKSQRVKEGSSDYRYFPEPDIPLMKFEDEMIEKIRSEIPELPQEKKWRYIKDFFIEADSAETIISNKGLYTYFEEVLDILKPDKKKLAKAVSNWMIGDLKRLCRKNETSFADTKVKPKLLIELINLIEQGKVSNNIGKDILTEIFETGKSPELIIKEKSLGTISGANELESVVKKVIDSNEKIVADYKDKNPNAIKFLIGQVMKETRGQADPIIAKQLLEKFSSR